MKTSLLKKIRTLFAIKSCTKSIHDYVHAMIGESRHSPYYEENKRLILEKILSLIDLLEELLHPDSPAPELLDYEDLSPEEVDLSLSELLVMFRQTIQKLQKTPLEVQEDALDILYSYFIEQQGLYDLIFVTHESRLSTQQLSLTAISDYQKRYLQLDEVIENDPLIQEYRTIPYKFLMKMSVGHHLHVILFDLLPRFVGTKLKECFRRTPACRRTLDPTAIGSVDELRQILKKHPLTESSKVYVAIHRHFMRVADIIFARIALKCGHPLFELLILAIWIQTVKDHIVPQKHRTEWQVEHLDADGEDPEKNAGAERIKMSSAFFMQPRITFRLQRFLIFKIRTMTVGDVVRATELGNWMRKNSPDEFLQFFNVALGDMGGLGIRTMPEHEILADQDTQWLTGALMSFIPGGMTSPGSISMRKTNYGLTKSQQLQQEILFYDPRFKGSTGFIADLRIMLGSLGVMNKGRIGKALEATESFKGRDRGV
ncbi:hypothetical protein CSB45_08110 [candidate division KSB3 bacterium]|uniref:Bacterial sugar transferase domain-containing protein n=1 Tax=candidate division KSB3 bacterium TaxID=2044937 RepID=A0A2G6E531_9BACT|nr:MAG: hypothetical protein CSB45_08110 [candidate division KSB3 bacterium]PIE29816.1 MAG: hypothetical protein CSA57_07105 [candidate division KSB3 bacterium]